MKKRTRFFLITLALLAGIAAIGYAAAPAIVAAIASRSLSGDFEVRELRIESVSPTTLEVAAVRLNDSRMRLDLQQGTVSYDLWPFSIREIDIERATLALSGTPGPVAGGAEVTLPAPPPFPLRIGQLMLKMETPWGALALPGSVASRPGPAGGMEVEVRSESLSVAVTNPEAGRHRVGIIDGRDASLLSLDIDTRSGWPVGLSGRLHPASVSAWLRDSPIPPDGLKSGAAPFLVESGDLDFKARLQENLDFETELRGDLQVRDSRRDEDRVFELVAIRAAGYGIARAGAAWSGSGSAAVRFSPVPDTTLNAADPDWQWSAGGVELVLQQAMLEELGLETESLTLSAPSISGPAIEGRLAASGLRLAPWPEEMAFYDVQGNWSLGEAATRVRGTGSGSGLPGLEWRFESGADTGRVVITSGQPVAPLSSTISRYTRAVARDLKIKNGELALRYQLEWNQSGQTTDLEVTASSLDADLDEMAVRGLQAALRSRGGTLDQLELTVAAPMLELAAGTVAEDLDIRARLSLPQIRIEKARTRLFGGSVSLEPTSINLDDESFTLHADIGGLSLERVMGLFALESTELTGEVSGPVRLVYDRERGLEINEGALHSIEPGTLRFSLGPDAGAPAQLNNIAMRALENFQYDELNASVLYKPDGEYRIKARILGRNPEVLDGHPIALNPTIEGRLPALFRAFFVTGDFSRAIIERLQEERNPSTPGGTSTLDGG